MKFLVVVVSFCLTELDAYKVWPMNKNKYAEFCIMCIRFVGKKLCARIENVCAVGVVGAVAYKHHSPNELFRAKNKRKKNKQ